MGWLSQFWGPGRQRIQLEESRARLNEDRVRSSMRDLTLARVEAEQAVGGVRQAAADQIEETRSLRVLLKDVIARVGSNTAARNAGR
jgi:hypothetical protein